MGMPSRTSTELEDMLPTCLSRKHTKDKVTSTVGEEYPSDMKSQRANKVELGLILGRGITGVQAFC